jgi:uroporphyrinogen-III decarboxylase
MTSRERITAALNHREPDRTPYFEYLLLNPVSSTLLGRKFTDYAGDMDSWNVLVREVGWERALRQYAKDRVDLAAILRQDMMYVSMNPNEPTCDVVLDSGHVSVESTDDPVENMIQSNNIKEEQLRNLSGKDFDDSFFVYALIKEEMRKQELDLPIMGMVCGHGVWTNVDLMQTMILEPETAHRHFSLATEYSRKVIGKFIESGVEQFIVGGDFAGNTPIISPECYRTFIVPEVRKLSRIIHESGRHAINASDGNLWSVIDDYLIGCEVDGCIEIDMHAGMELGKLKRMYGDRITLFGNMDCGNMLSFCSPEEIRGHTVECIEKGLGNGGHVFCASNAISKSISIENYMAMVGAYREYFNLPMIKVG